MNPVSIVIKREIDTIAFYEKAAERTSNAGGRQMFLSIVQDEKQHLEEIKGIAKDCRLGGTPCHAKQRPAMTKAVQVIRPDTDEIEALRVAIEREKELIISYRKLLRSVKTTWEREFFARLIGESQEYYEKLTNTYAFITDSADWYLHEEYSITDGGTGWA